MPSFLYILSSFTGKMEAGKKKIPEKQQNIEFKFESQKVIKTGELYRHR